MHIQRREPLLVTLLKRITDLSESEIKQCPVTIQDDIRTAQGILKQVVPETYCGKAGESVPRRHMEDRGAMILCVHCLNTIHEEEGLHG